MTDNSFKIDFNTDIDFNEVVTLSDLEEKEYQGLTLEKLELEALRLFREIRLRKLRKKEKLEDQFHSNFEYFRAISNLMDYKDFLKKGI